MIKDRIVIATCILIATLVLFSSMHSAQVFGATFAAAQDAKKAATHDDISLVKLSADLHHHLDKSGTQLIKDGADQQLLADSRSLRLRHTKNLPSHNRLAGWLRAWWEMSAAYFG